MSQHQQTVELETSPHSTLASPFITLFPASPPLTPPKRPAHIPSDKSTPFEPPIIYIPNIVIPGITTEETSLNPLIIHDTPNLTPSQLSSWTTSITNLHPSNLPTMHQVTEILSTLTNISTHTNALNRKITRSRIHSNPFAYSKPALHSEIEALHSAAEKAQSAALLCLKPLNPYIYKIQCLINDIAPHHDRDTTHLQRHRDAAYITGYRETTTAVLVYTQAIRLRDVANAIVRELKHHGVVKMLREGGFGGMGRDVERLPGMDEERGVRVAEKYFSAGLYGARRGVRKVVVDGDGGDRVGVVEL
ncbi:hypothetical protein P280DRAFT_551814 [Massarina eburnea CBS 473.64]|uniref:Uncharacterized protein n=1 Tax=Massarina eburnea CBS 473.64 TaxID=1395130 RepID=A0A6A6RR06_9PLEO|nr:hypothetical protein P280DRAFT_551814 [Massarina eburnea CBS 473.64]